MGWATKSWSPIDASVVASSFVTDSRPGRSSLYYPIVRYQYSLNGKCYEGSQYTYMGKVGSSKKYVDSVVSKYSVGSELMVFYDPASPGVSVIIPGVHWLNYVYLASLFAPFLSIAFLPEILCVSLPDSRACDLTFFSIIVSMLA